MKAIPTEIEGVYIIEPRVFHDARGYFFESYSKAAFDQAVGREIDFVQDNESASSFGVIRGLHFQRPPYAQAKLVRCVRGAVLDVVVDLRKGSPTFGRHIAVELNEDNHLELFLPHGMAHGFSVLSPKAIFQYKCDNYYAPQSEGGIDLLDPDLAIDWRISPDQAILSEKDTRHCRLNDFESPFEY